jgi:predicted transcriptional regulator
MRYGREDPVPATHPAAVNLDPETRARFEALAAVRDRSAHRLMPEAVAPDLDREERREGFRQDAQRA